MAQYIILDIETNRIPFEEFDASQQEYLLRGVTTEEEQQRKIMEMALSPLTGHVVCIGMKVLSVDAHNQEEVEKSICLMKNDTLSENEHSKSELLDNTLMVEYNERALLQNFWTFLQRYPSAHYITFNGRNFDFPYLMLRSAVLEIRPTVNLMRGSRWNYNQYHTDLLDELCFQTFSSNGATRRFNFDFFAKSFGIASPKADGVDGSKVNDLYADGQYATIAEYCLRDVTATWELYKKWKQFMQF